MFKHVLGDIKRKISISTSVFNVTAEKLQLLKQILAKEKKLAVAFSGGTDSTFLLSVSIEVLGTANVWALHLNSALQGSESARQISRIIANDFPTDLQFEQVDIYPLDWQEFVKNSQNRCYHCKKEMYSVLLSKAASLKIKTLADGTNSDDLMEHRPGLRALRELKILTPLELAGLRKTEIRFLSKERRLSNHNLASNSCLATRIEPDKKITKTELELVDDAESFITGHGFKGSRVRVGGSHTIIEIEEKDFLRLINSPMRKQIEEKFKKLGLPNPSLRLKAR